MARKSKFVPVLRRRREGKVDYAARRKIIMSRKPFASVRVSNKHVQVQIASADAEGDKMITSANSAELPKMGWKMGMKNIPSAYLTGLLAGKRAAEANLKEIVLYSDVKPFVHGSRVAAAVKGLRDGGAPVLSAEDIFPLEDRLKGEHIAKFLDEIVQKRREESNFQFAKISHSKSGAKEYAKEFEVVKTKIMSLKVEERKGKSKREIQKE